MEKEGNESVFCSVSCGGNLALKCYGPRYYSFAFSFQFTCGAIFFTLDLN